MEKREWFAEWFDTSYYHILYKNRNEEEAAQFISRLLNLLDLPKSSHVLDLCCGKGRHARTLNQHGYIVTGVDLSENSINSAKAYSSDTLNFAVHDMREPMKDGSFDAVFNLFTSFGYFDEIAVNNQVVKCVHDMLKSKGIFVIDFMNAARIVSTLVEKETKVVDGITFNISRKYDGTHIFKRIQFDADGHSFDFTERVQALKENDFQQLLTANGFQILHTFGDFELNPFNEQDSDRLILIARRN